LFLGDDAISIEGQSDHIWLDHDDISDGTDGNLDITHACDFITVFVDQVPLLVRAHRPDRLRLDRRQWPSLQQSRRALRQQCQRGYRAPDHHLHHNWWADYVVERQPRVRFGRVHVFNNLYTSVGDDYCIGVGVGANLRTENNVFVGVKTPIDTADYSDTISAVRSTGNVYPAGFTAADLQASSVFDPASLYTYTLDDTSGLQAAIQSGAGPK